MPAPAPAPASAPASAPAPAPTSAAGVNASTCDRIISHADEAGSYGALATAALLLSRPAPAELRAVLQASLAVTRSSLSAASSGDLQWSSALLARGSEVDRGCCSDDLHYTSYTICAPVLGSSFGGCSSHTSCLGFLLQASQIAAAAHLGLAVTMAWEPAALLQSDARGCGDHDSTLTPDL